jgi:hypothetical protein
MRALSDNYHNPVEMQQKMVRQRLLIDRMELDRQVFIEHIAELRHRAELLQARLDAQMAINARMQLQEMDA